MHSFWNIFWKCHKTRQTFSILIQNGTHASLNSILENKNHGGLKTVLFGYFEQVHQSIFGILKDFVFFFSKKKIIPSQSPLQESKSKSKQPINRVRFFVLLSLDRYVISYHLGRNFGPFKICQFLKTFFILFSLNIFSV